MAVSALLPATLVFLLATSATGKTEFSVLTMNMACRDTPNFVGCDNCETRFGLMAAALRGDAGYTGVPDLNAVDLVIAQEVGTDNADLYKALADVLVAKGFTRSLDGSNVPHPDKDSPQCRSQWPPSSFLDDAAEFFFPNGGLVVWSKYPILAYQDRDWCSHGFPTISGFVSVLLNVENVPVSVTNVHMFPQVGTACAFGLQSRAEGPRAGMFLPSRRRPWRLLHACPVFALAHPPCS